MNKHLDYRNSDRASQRLAPTRIPTSTPAWSAPRQPAGQQPWLLLLPLAGLVGLTGCTGFDRALFDQKVEAIPGQIVRTNTVYITNRVELPAVTNVVTNWLSGEVTQTIKPPETKIIVTPTISYDYAPPTLVTNLVPRAGVQSLLDVGGGLPLPFAGALAALLGWAYSFYASVRNKKIAAGLVQSVQRGREFLQSTAEGRMLDEKFKAVLAEHQDTAGIVAEVDRLLARYVDAKK